MIEIPGTNSAVYVPQCKMLEFRRTDSLRSENHRQRGNQKQKKKNRDWRNSSLDASMEKKKRDSAGLGNEDVKPATRGGGGVKQINRANSRQ